MERGSKFLAYASPVQSEEEIHLFIQSIKKNHPKARHYCTAFRLQPDASLERSNDDGEPSGSAGRPILGQLTKYNLTNVCIVVTRYFGGTKLGIPGLIEAYKTSASNAIEAATIVERRVFGKVELHLSYDAFPHFLNYCKQNNIPVVDESFSDQASIVIGFRKSSLHTELMSALRQFSQMDFSHLEEYAVYLGAHIEFPQGEYIL